MVDLRTCDKGDILISRHGKMLRYLRPTYCGEYLDHIVQYIDKEGYKGLGSRTHDGYVFLKNRKPETDHDIINIIKISKIFQEV